MIKPDLKQAGKALTKLAKAIVTGEAVLVSDKVLENRLAACAACGFFESASRQCKVCTCFVDVKANLSTESCPKKKWKE